MEKGKEVKAFFNLLKVGMWPKPKKQVSVDGTLDWNGVYRLASEQSVLGLVLAGIDCLPIAQRPPKVLLLQWIGEIQMLEQQNLSMNQFIGKLVEKMCHAGITTLLVKGQGIAQCYERPLWRACGDVDFLLSEENYRKAKELLLPMASSSETEEAYGKHLGMTVDDWTVELHGTMRCGLSRKMDGVVDEAQKDCFHGGNVRTWMNGMTQVFLPSPDNDVILVFTHFIKHFYKEGVGLRQICDWSRLLWTYRETINVVQLEKRLRSAGLLTEWKAFGAFAVEYLEMPAEAMPLYESSSHWERKAKRICGFVLDVGGASQSKDNSFYKTKPYLTRKAISFGRKCGTLKRIATIFPKNTIAFFPYIVFNGVRSVVRGE